MSERKFHSNVTSSMFPTFNTQEKRLVQSLNELHLEIHKDLATSFLLEEEGENMPTQISGLDIVYCILIPTIARLCAPICSLKLGTVSLLTV